jgi:hypothetical protein
MLTGIEIYGNEVLLDALAALESVEAPLQEPCRSAMGSSSFNSTSRKTDMTFTCRDWSLAKQCKLYSVSERGRNPPFRHAAKSCSAMNALKRTRGSNSPLYTAGGLRFRPSSE